MVEFLQKIDRKEPYDAHAFDVCLRNSIEEAVRLQADAGVDIVSDGEYGKAVNRAFYVQMRLDGIERRPLTAEKAKNPLNTVVGGRDREAFPEFYGEYDARMIRAGTVRPVVTGPISYSGHAELQRDIGNLKAALAKVKGVEGFLSVVAPASALPNVKDEHYGADRRGQPIDFLICDGVKLGNLFTSLARKPSTALSQDAEVGVKWNVAIFRGLLELTEMS